MKQICYFFLVLGCVLCSSYITPDGYVVRGIVEGLKEGKVYAIRQRGKDIADTLAEVEIKNGKFLLEGQVKEITPVFLKVENAGNVLVFLENNAVFEVVYSRNDLPRVKGGGESQRLSAAYDSIGLELSQEYMKIESAVVAAYRERDSSKIEKFRKIKNKMIRDNERKQDIFLYEHGNTFFALYDLSQKALGMHSLDVKARYALLDDRLKATSLGKEISGLLPKLENLVVGKKVPDFVAITPDGKEVSLYSIKCKVKLIDFWASTCGVCREENKLNVSLYNQYHSHGFDVISYSLDRKKEAWLDAIREDALPWTQVSDLDAEKADRIVKDFGVYYLPTTLLVDGDNRIIALNVKYRDLVKMLPELLPVK